MLKTMQMYATASKLHLVNRNIISGSVLLYRLTVTEVLLQCFGNILSNKIFSMLHQILINCNIIFLQRESV